MYFSESVGVKYQSSFDWFDPVLDTDTQLFVDPFLIYEESSGVWADAHDELIGYFQAAFELLAPAWDKPHDQRYRRTETVMTFPEPKEFGLGFVAEGQDGAGTASGFARLIVAAMAEAIARGLEDMSHFEELGLLVPGIGRDRISDITCNILKHRFIKYTQDVCINLGIEMQEVEVASAALDPIRRRRVPRTHWLPVNKITGRPVILTPKRFLRELPTLNARDWWHFAEHDLRADVNLDISLSVDKKLIIDLARSHAEKVREWTEKREDQPSYPYKVDRDPAGLHNWLRMAQKFVADNPISYAVTDADSLDVFIGKIIDYFRQFVELQGGWRLLWNDDNGKPKRETSIQLLFKGIVQAQCAANGVMLDREVELGRGPVDFVISTSAAQRVLLEVKRVSSNKLIDGLTKQLVSYIESDGCGRGWYLAVRFYDSGSELRKVEMLRAATKDARQESGFDLKTAVVDATRKKSASKL
ncbi:hypothetical protein [Puerhibacterium puerhi]|uniref:hypothetical protein n=1 Tax=Puerhibacterium puerhi TaxID=2692623 RepID=UPI00135B5306|nr:hypothetical protein [Puerhibacterium puerhi]